MRRNAFTLIELIVCVAIVSCLFALLLPAVIKARDASRAARCQSNLHNIAVEMLHGDPLKPSHLSETLCCPCLPPGTDGVSYEYNFAGWKRCRIMHEVDLPSVRICIAWEYGEHRGVSYAAYLDGHVRAFEAGDQQ